MKTKVEKTFADVLCMVHDFVRYTFTPAFGALGMTGSLVVLTSVVVCAMINEPLLIIVIFCAYIAVFFTAMLASLRAWIKYRNFYQSIFRSEIQDIITEVKAREKASK